MKNRKYQLLLVEDFLDTSLQSQSTFSGKYISKPVLEIASSEANFLWQAHDIEFYTKIDGTHELSFQLEEKYFNEDKGALVDNELVQYLTNKCKIEVRRENLEYSTEDNPVFDTYFMVINSREDKENKSSISYSYSCTDAYIEELSKTGYDIVFSDDLDYGNSVGTIHDFSSQIAKNCDWEYRADKTGVLYEYLTETVWNEEQQRFDDIRKPQFSYKYDYISELRKYAYRLETCASFTEEDGEIYYQPYYVTEEDEAVVTVPEKNLLANSNEFFDTVGWTLFSKSSAGQLSQESLYSLSNTKVNGDYCLKISKTKNEDINPNYLMNDTMTDNNTSLKAYQLYLFKYTINNTDNCVKGIYLHNKSLQIPDLKISKADYVLNKNMTRDTYYVIKPTKDIPHPYLAMQTKLSGKSACIVNVQFFKVQGKDKDSHLRLMSELTNGQAVTQAQLDMRLLPLEPGEEDTSTVSSYVVPVQKFFYRKNYRIKLSSDESQQIDLLNEDKETLEYQLFDKVNTASKKIGKINNTVTIMDNYPYSIVTVDELPLVGDPNIVYFLSSDRVYYQYYVMDSASNGQWNSARLGDGKNDKIRSFVASKSNRFNLIQELSELFQAWPVFNITRNNDGTLTKEFWYRESALRENFSGFHKGVNLSSVTRKLESNEIVTKIYVEDVEKSYITDGKISIAESSLNPWGERYYYNFKYYIEQNLVGMEIETDLQNLYTLVKALNEEILKESTDLIEYNTLYYDNKQKIHEYELQISSCAQQIIKLDETINNLNDDSLPDKQTAKTNKNREKKKKSELEAKLKQLNSQTTKLGKKITSSTEKINELTTQKVQLISQFENKYISFIKEGTWVDSSYSNNDTYYIDSQKVSNTSAIPKASWTIDVIDSTNIEELKDFVFKVGDKTFLVDNDFFKVNKKGKDYKFEILITGYRDHFDNITKNQAEVRNYLTSFDDLFQRVSAATQTLELNEQIYDKASRFTADGEVNKDVIQKTFYNNNFVLSNSQDNSYELSSNGLKLQSISNPTKQMTITADGIFISDKKDTEGNALWNLGITADGIDATLIRTGELDTSVIKIFSSKTEQELFSWNDLGITAYHSNNEDAHFSFTRFDQYGVYVVTKKTKSNENYNFNYVDEDNTPWFSGMSRAEATSLIQNYADVSLTDNGFKLNIKGSNGSLVMGYLGEDESEYGLEIKDKNSNVLVNLSNNMSNNQIGSFKINSGWLYGDSFGVRGNAPSSSWVYLYAGKDWKRTGSIDDVDMPFYVRGNGELHSKTAVFGEWNINLNSSIPNAFQSNWLKDNGSANDYYQVTLSALREEGPGWAIFRVSKKEGSNGIPEHLAYITASGEIHCKKLYINDQEVVPGGTGGNDWVNPESFEKSPPYNKSSAGYINPLQYNNIYISAHYGSYPSGGSHHGTDYCYTGGTYGRNARAIYDGVVESINNCGSAYGNHILLKHTIGSGSITQVIYSLYAHGSAINPNLQEGSVVHQGDIVLKTGNTGNVSPAPTPSDPYAGAHLHLELRSSPSVLGDINPENYVPMP